MMLRVLMPLVALLALGGCDTTRSLQSLRKAPLSGSAFDRALAQEYLRHAESELKVYDWWSSKYFADKGMLAAYGKPVEPEQPAQWDLGTARTELADARTRMMARLGGDYRARQPEAAAKLQAAFDCWVEQQEERDEDGIADCKGRWQQLMGEGARETVAMGGPLSTSYLLYFPWDSTDIEGVAYDELRSLAQSIKHQDGYQIIINGHADSSGEDDYNMELSQDRADEVREFLMNEGVGGDQILYYAFGESDPKVPTQDGVKKRANRRVEIFIE